MIRCPHCQAENLPDALSCAICRTNLAAEIIDDVPTQRTRPRLLILRPAPKESGPAAGEQTDRRAGSPADPTQTPSLPGIRLKVLRGLRMSTEYPLYDGPNLIGRGDDRPVDIDLRDQEPGDRVWASRNHAVVTLAAGAMTVEDLNSTNGTYVNRHRLLPGSKRPLKANDVLQIGAIQLKVTG